MILRDCLGRVKASLAHARRSAALTRSARSRQYAIIEATGTWCVMLGSPGRPYSTDVTWPRKIDVKDCKWLADACPCERGSGPEAGIVRTELCSERWCVQPDQGLARGAWS